MICPPDLGPLGALPRIFVVLLLGPMPLLVSCGSGGGGGSDGGEACEATCESPGQWVCAEGTAALCAMGDAGCAELEEAVTCDDEDACTEVECSPAAGCVLAPLDPDDGDVCNGQETCDPATGVVAGTPLTCSDGLECTGEEACDPVEGCQLGTPPAACCEGHADCDDGTPCNGQGLCDLPTGTCLLGPGPSCSDGNPCNGLETCSGEGSCEPGTPKVCDDGNACNGLEVCEVDQGCLATPFAPCDDGLPCNGLETCDPASGCVVGDPLPGCAASDADCEDGNVCNGTGSFDAETSTCAVSEPVPCEDGDPCDGVSICDATEGCFVFLDPPECEDGNPCNGEAYCEEVVGCDPGTPPECDDGQNCTGIELCDPALGCAPPELVPECDDGDGCNGTEACDESLGCVAGSEPSCEDGDACTEDSCDPATGCVNPEIPCDDGDTCTVDGCDPASGCTGDPLDCDDGSPCTTDTCAGAEGCVSETLDCDDEDDCTSESCDPVDGCVYETVECDDGDACTEDECRVDAGCVAPPLDCDDEDECTEDSCDVATGCVNVDVVCDDGVFCNGTESCDSAGGCVPGVAPAPDDAISCTNDSCNEELGAVVNVPDHQLCQDEDLCNGSEICQPGVGCEAGKAPDCDDGDACTTGTCDPGEGCQVAPVDCDDGNSCTEDACVPEVGCTVADVPDLSTCELDGPGVCLAGTCESVLLDGTIELDTTGVHEFAIVLEEDTTVVVALESFASGNSLAVVGADEAVLATAADAQAVALLATTTVGPDPAGLGRIEVDLGSAPATLGVLRLPVGDFEAPATSLSHEVWGGELASTLDVGDHAKFWISQPNGPSTSAFSQPGELLVVFDRQDQLGGGLEVRILGPIQDGEYPEAALGKAEANKTSVARATVTEPGLYVVEVTALEEDLALSALALSGLEAGDGEVVDAGYVTGDFLPGGDVDSIVFEGIAGAPAAFVGHRVPAAPVSWQVFPDSGLGGGSGGGQWGQLTSTFQKGGLMVLELSSGEEGTWETGFPGVKEVDGGLLSVTPYSDNAPSQPGQVVVSELSEVDVPVRWLLIDPHPPAGQSYLPNWLQAGETVRVAMQNLEPGLDVDVQLVGPLGEGEAFLGGIQSGVGEVFTTEIFVIPETGLYAAQLTAKVGATTVSMTAFVDAGEDDGQVLDQGAIDGAFASGSDIDFVLVGHELIGLTRAVSFARTDGTGGWGVSGYGAYAGTSFGGGTAAPTLLLDKGRSTALGIGVVQCTAQGIGGPWQIAAARYSELFADLEDDRTLDVSWTADNGTVAEVSGTLPTGHTATFPLTDGHPLMLDAAGGRNLFVAAWGLGLGASAAKLDIEGPLSSANTPTFAFPLAEVQGIAWYSMAALDDAGPIRVLLRDAAVDAGFHLVAGYSDPGDPDDGAIALGSVSGTLGVDDIDYWLVPGEAGQVLTVSMNWDGVPVINSASIFMAGWTGYGGPLPHPFLGEDLPKEGVSILQISGAEGDYTLEVTVE